MLKQGGKILSSSKDSDFSFGKTRRLNPLLVQRNSDFASQNKEDLYEIRIFR